jgi:hypothetical protein
MRRAIIVNVVSVTIMTVAFAFALINVRASFFPVPSFGSRILFEDSAGSVPFTERVSFWRESLQLSAMRPLTGWGPESFRFAAEPLQRDVFSTADDPHNIILGLAAERGWIAALAFLFLCTVILSRTLRASTINKETIACIVGILGLLLHSLVDRDVQFAALMLPLWILLGTLTPSSTHKKSAHSHLPSIIEACIAAILIALLFVTQSGDAPLQDARTLIDSGHNAEATTILGHYARLSPTDPRVWILLGDATLAKGDSDAALADYDHAFQLGRLNYPTIAEGFVHVADAKNDPRILDDRRSEIITTINAFADAIHTNNHDIVLSDAPQQVAQIIDYLSVFPSWNISSLASLRTAILSAASAAKHSTGPMKRGFFW